MPGIEPKAYHAHQALQLLAHSLNEAAHEEYERGMPERAKKFTKLESGCQTLMDSIQKLLEQISGSQEQ